MTDETIRPALTPEEWAEAFERARSGRMYAYEGLAPEQAMAFANAELPDGHPNKLTRNDFELVRSMVRPSAALGLSPAEYVTRFDALARKLEALLPPQ